MTQVITNAGKFELECWTSGSPLWVHLRVEGREIEGIHLVADDLRDLIHAAQRMLQKTEIDL